VRKPIGRHLAFLLFIFSESSKYRTNYESALAYRFHQPAASRRADRAVIGTAAIKPLERDNQNNELDSPLNGCCQTFSFFFSFFFR